MDGLNSYGFKKPTRPHPNPSHKGVYVTRHLNPVLRRRRRLHAAGTLKPRASILNGTFCVRMRRQGQWQNAAFGRAVRENEAGQTGSEQRLFALLRCVHRHKVSLTVMIEPWQKQENWERNRGFGKHHISALCKAWRQIPLFLKIHCFWFS